MFSNEIVTYTDRFTSNNQWNLSTNFGNAPANAVAISIKRIAMQWSQNITNASSVIFCVTTSSVLNTNPISPCVFLTPKVSSSTGTLYEFQEVSNSINKLSITGGTPITLYIFTIAGVAATSGNITNAMITYTYHSATNYSYLIDIRSTNGTVMSSTFVPINIGQANGLTLSPSNPIPINITQLNSITVTNALDTNIKAVNGTNLSSNFLPT